MAVKVTKPEINVTEKINELDRKPGEFGNKLYQSETSDEWNKITDLEASPLPYWTGFYPSATNVGQTNSNHTFLDSGNQRYYTMNNGNNGPNARFRMHGTLRGEFELGFTLGYSWGWSGIWVAPRSNFDPLINYQRDSNAPHCRLFNNSSNNLCYASYKDYGDTSYTNTTQISPGFSSGMFKLWRDSTGMMYFRPPNNTDYSLFKTTEDIYIANETQPPNFVKLEYVLNRSHKR